MRWYDWVGIAVCMAAFCAMYYAEDLAHRSTTRCLEIQGRCERVAP